MKTQAQTTQTRQATRGDLRRVELINQRMTFLTNTIAGLKGLPCYERLQAAFDTFEYEVSEAAAEIEIELDDRRASR
jgi:hypothetical protein